MANNGELKPWPIVGTYVALLLLLALTLAVTRLDLGFWNPLLNLTIAALQAALVMVYFMRLRWERPMLWVVALTGFFFLVIMAVFILSDFLTRGME